MHQNGKQIMSADNSKLSKTKQIQVGSEICINGEVTEILVLGKKEWVSIRLPSKQIITINKKHICIPN